MAGAGAAVGTAARAVLCGKECGGSPGARGGKDSPKKRRSSPRADWKGNQSGQTATSPFIYEIVNWLSPFWNLMEDMHRRISIVHAEALRKLSFRERVRRAQAGFKRTRGPPFLAKLILAAPPRQANLCHMGIRFKDHCCWRAKTVRTK